MRLPFAHDAVLQMEPDGDLGAPGAAITIALCGHWEHEPPCPLAPHHTAAQRAGAQVRLRTLFAVEPAREAEVRARIDAALAAGTLADADGDPADAEADANRRPSRWRLCSSGAAAVRPDETEHARRLASS